MSDFVDRVTVHVKGGDGGNGSAGVRRENTSHLQGQMAAMAATAEALYS